MAGLGKMLKQAQKMQRQMEKIQEELAEKDLSVSCGGGAINIVINGQGEFQSIKIDPEFLKEDADVVEETLLEAIKQAADEAKTTGEEAMSAVSGGMGIPGLM